MSSPRFRLTRRKSVLALACVCCLAVLGLAAHAYLADSTDEEGMDWTLDDLRSVRGPRDLWSFLNGDMARRRRQLVLVMGSFEGHVEWVHLLQAEKQNDWPMFGGTPQRNMANTSSKNIPADWSDEAGKLRNIKWMAQLGTKSYGAPVIADGKVFVGTNNDSPRDPAVKGMKATLMCFNEADGKFLWQAVTRCRSAI
jgi:outer membrane protein assembly factor BamB